MCVTKMVFLVARTTVNNIRDLRELGLKIRKARNESKKIIFLKYIEKNYTI